MESSLVSTLVMLGGGRGLYACQGCVHGKFTGFYFSHAGRRDGALCLLGAVYFESSLVSTLVMLGGGGGALCLSGAVYMESSLVSALVMLGGGGDFMLVRAVYMESSLVTT